MHTPPQGRPRADVASTPSTAAIDDSKKVEDETKTPQESLNEFWNNLVTKKPSKVTNIFPPTLYANLLPPKQNRGTVKGKNAAESYRAAVEECRTRVKRIVRECHRTNEKFTDPEFDIEGDGDERNCLDLLVSRSKNTRTPRSVHRIDWIFEKPSFTVDGFSGSSVKQGQVGDCWFIAALSTTCSKPSLMEKICVERDEECGVYGFVFFRDGEWISTVVDDNLYLSNKDYEGTYDPEGEKGTEYKTIHQTGSKALYFASSTNPNETWLPLMEKAYAKVHGDFEAIDGGQSGEGVEDLTGGVNTVIKLNRVMSKEKLWQELLQVNKQFLFSAISLDKSEDPRFGLPTNHTYSILRAVEEEDEQGQKKRLVQIRNPWGKPAAANNGEWNGAWSDGSEEWTAFWLQKLNYSFAKNGIFWMSFNDVCKYFAELDRTRLFDEEWTVVQRWASSGVAWMTGYLNTKFIVDIKKGGPTVFVLSQLDERYFMGLDGRYTFNLHFILKEADSTSADYIVRARCPRVNSRSVSAEIDLEPGTYEVIPKIVANRYDELDVCEVVAKLADKKPQKLRQIGMNYDIAHAKALVEPSKAEQEAVEENKRKAEKEKAELEAYKAHKVEFEAWQKERREREAFEAWQKEKNGSAETTTSDSQPVAQETPAEAMISTNADAAQTTPATEVNQQTDADKKKEKVSKPWNAVCVFGLRVYSKDKEVTIRLVKPKDAEASSLDVGGATQAGATMSVQTRSQL
ncbi:cysteine proteinase [Byssothecium circinans]|uniref:Cysteine proteinase n=1 Tax=Byssothecium circinans TaxID=147558 RepID=A0A6A5TC19_9PLEO|nr:cysteine proteinase [Byssothecium circinans]